MSETQKGRRANGDGCVYKQKNSRFWWVAYQGPDGKEHRESSKTEIYDEATHFLRKRLGAVAHNLPVVAKAEQWTLKDACDAVLDDFRTNGKKSIRVVERRFNKHLLPYFGERRKMASITAGDVRKYVNHRQAQGIVNKEGVRVSDVSNAEINRELQVLKRAFNLAIQDGRLGMRPHISMLKEAAPRTGFFEPEQFASVLKHMPEELRPVLRFGYITGWRMKSEVFGLEWRQVDFDRGVVTLDPGTTKNGDGRTFFLTQDLRTLLLEQQQRSKTCGHIVPWVFFRMVAKGRRGPKAPKPITSITKAWKNACRSAGCPGRIPHDFRRTAVRNLDRAGVPRSVAMRMVGHKTEAIYRRYRIVDDQDLRDAAARLDAVAIARG